MKAETLLRVEELASGCRAGPDEVVSELLAEARSLASGSPCDAARCEAVVSNLYVLGLVGSCGCPPSEVDALIDRIRSDGCAQVRSGQQLFSRVSLSLG